MHAYIDILRGCAILLVISLHCSQHTPFEWPLLQYIGSNGGKGVQLFYLVSALTLTMSWHSRESHNFSHFYLRRFFRIAPLFYVAIAYYLLTGEKGPQYWAPEGIQAWQVALTASFLHGLHPYAINSVVPGGWSIAVEVSFYAAFPIILTYCTNLSRSLFFFATSAIAFLVLRNPLIHFLEPHFPPSSQYLIHDFPYRSILGQLPTFAFGICLYYIMNMRKKVVCAMGLALTLSGVMLLIAAFLSNDSTLKKLAENPFISTFYLSGFILLTSLINPRNIVLEKIGQLSYGGYLFNVAIIEAMMNPGLPSAIATYISTSGTAFFLTVCITLMVASQFAHQLIEQPGINLGRSIIEKLKAGSVH